MHPVSRTSILVIIITLAATGFLLYFQPVSSIRNKTGNLNQALSSIPGWQSYDPDTLDVAIVDALKLDDYINRSFSREGKTISLYIGYYNSSKKVGAAHDPMVCFPGQGWVLTDKKKGKLELNSQTSDPISYSLVIAKKGDQKQLVLYWFQSYDVTSSNTFSQKLSLIWKRLFRQGEDNAFVRVIAPIDNNSISENRDVIIGFIKDFYPIFLNYIVDKDLILKK